MDVLDVLDISICLTDSLCESQVRMIERESVSASIGLSLERPLDQRVGVDDGDELMRTG